MKILIIILITFLVSTNSFSISNKKMFDLSEIAKRIKFNTNYKNSIELGKKENKLIMMVIVSERCKWCKKIENSLNSFMIRENNRFIKLIVAKHEIGTEYPNKFTSPIIPIIYYIDPYTEKYVWQSIGFKTKSKISKDMKMALEIRKEIIEEGDD